MNVDPVDKYELEKWQKEQREQFGKPSLSHNLENPQSKFKWKKCSHCGILIQFDDPKAICRSCELKWN